MSSASPGIYDAAYEHQFQPRPIIGFLTVITDFFIRMQKTNVFFEEDISIFTSFTLSHIITFKTIPHS